MCASFNSSHSSDNKDYAGGVDLDAKVPKRINSKAKRKQNRKERRKEKKAAFLGHAT